MADKAHILTDKEIEKMERHLSAIYSRAEKELSEKADKYFERFRKRDEKMRELLDAGKIDRKEYDTWRKNQLMTGRHWTEMKRQAAHRLTQADQEAADYINGRLPSVYALNYNAVSDGLETRLKGYSFELVDANTVKNLATQDKTLLPYKYIDGAKAERWHTQRVNAEVLQGILQGESIPKIAKRLRDNVGMSARGSAVRNARTAVTSAENKGRMDMLHDAEDKGVKAEKGWLAAHDARVRESHAQVDGEFVGIDDEFSNGLQFPGDPDGAPEEVYNCRCTMIYKVVDIKSAKEKNDAYDEIEELKRQLEGTPVEKEKKYLIDKNTGKYIGANVNGDAFGLVDSIKDATLDKKQYDKALSSTKFMKKKGIVVEEKIEKVIELKPLSFSERQKIEEKIQSIMAGYGNNVFDYRAAKEAKKAKTLSAKIDEARSSFWAKAARKDLTPFYSDKEDVYFNKTSAIELFSRYAKKLGAEEIHTSAKGGSKFSSSVYLKIGDFELRVSDHFLPETYARQQADYRTRWNDEFVFDDDGIKELLGIKTEEDFKKWILSKFRR